MGDLYETCMWWAWGKNVWVVSGFVDEGFHGFVGGSVGGNMKVGQIELCKFVFYSLNLLALTDR